MYIISNINVLVQACIVYEFYFDQKHNILYIIDDDDHVILLYNRQRNNQLTKKVQACFLYYWCFRIKKIPNNEWSLGFEFYEWS